MNAFIRYLVGRRDPSARRAKPRGLVPAALGILFLSVSAQAQWARDGQLFATYGSMRDQLVEAFRGARTRVGLVSLLLNDGDVATGLLSAKLRGLQVEVLLDKAGLRQYSSRHDYLLSNQVPLVLSTLSPSKLGAATIVALDDVVWRIYTGLDYRAGGRVRVERAAYSGDEVFAWFKDPRVETAKARASRLPRGAKTPTNPRRSESKRSAKIDSGRNAAEEGIDSPIPRRLPRETRLEQIQQGKIAPDSRSPGESGGPRMGGAGATGLPDETDLGRE